MFVFARDWRLALPLLFGPTLRCLGISLYCLLTFNFGNERTQSRHRYEITRATRSRHLYESVPFSRSLREKETRLNILFPKSSGSFLRSKKLSLRSQDRRKQYPRLFHDIFVTVEKENSFSYVFGKLMDPSRFEDGHRIQEYSSAVLCCLAPCACPLFTHECVCRVCTHVDA